MPTTSSATTLDAVRARRRGREDAELALVFTVVEWALEHTVSTDFGAATYVETFGDTGLTLAGEGAPVVSEFATYELAAALGMSSDAGKSYLGRVLEVRYRLPRLWEEVGAGRVPFWRAGRIAEQTLTLPEAGARFVDERVSAYAGRVGPAQVERLVDQALVRFDPEKAADRARARAEDRHFDVHLRDAEASGTVAVSGVLDATDALDLEHAVLRTAAALATLGCEESPQVRRSLAVGQIARTQLTLDLNVAGPGLDTPHSLALPRHSTNEDSVVGRVPARDEVPVVGRVPASGEGSVVGRVPARDEGSVVGRVPARDEGSVVGRVPARDERVYRDRTPATAGRGITLYLHLTEGDEIATLDHPRTPILLDQVRTWCQTSGTTVTIKPVIDLASTSSTDERLRTDSYVVPGRIAEHVRLRDRTCVFPWCPRRSDRCDLDHVIPYAAGGPTSTENLAPLCRRHHRAKTHSAWTYRVMTPGRYAWTSPTGLTFTVDTTGTRPAPDDTEP